jgi:hypothetical protein
MQIKKFYNFDTGDLNYKPFYDCNLRIFEIAGVFVPGKPLQPSLMFVCKARGLP